MTFQEVLAQVIAWLQREQRVSYRAIKRQLALDDDYLEDLKDELIYAKKLAVDEEGRVLVWRGGIGTTHVPASQVLQPEPLPATQEAHPTQGGPPQAPHGTPEAERRQLTVLFCDLVDSTRLARQLDPEDWRDVVRAYQQVCAEVIQRFDGYIAQYLGDGLLVYFGYPQAHEDDAQRAGRAGLGILEAMGPLNGRLEQERGIRLAVRVGLHTGPVVVGAMGGGGRQEQLAMGDTPNLAGRLQGLAAPNTVVVSAATLKLIEGFFTGQTRGAHALKGVDEPMLVYQVLAESGAQTRLDIVAPHGLTPLVGREQEVGLLLESWAQSREGRGQVVLLSGEAGIGKSRLVEVLRERVGHERATWLTFRCSPYNINSALYPVITHLQRFLQFRREDTLEQRLDKLESVLQAARFPLQEAVPLFAALLAVPLAERYPSLDWSPQKQKQKTQEALVRWLVAEAERQPVLAVWEDLHWADPSTLELLGLVIHQTPTVPLLTLLTCRPEFHPPWLLRSHCTQLTLSRFTRPQVEEMVRRITGGKALPAEVVQQIVVKTDGVPLFVEELTKMVLEADLLREHEDRYDLTGPLPSLAIPTTLHDSLMARLDRLATPREIAQLAATLGREFAYEVLQAIAPLDEVALQRGLSQLVDAELIYQRGLPPQAQYVFKHALIRDAAYQSLLKSTRQQFHQRIAQVLEARFPDTAEAQPELVAHHFTEAGLHAQAVGYWHKAGQRAIERSAHVEAIAHLTKGLEALKALPNTPQRAQHELALQLALGAPLQATRGYAAPERRQAYTKAWKLCQQVGETSQRFPVLFGLWQCYALGAEWQAARAAGEQLLSLAQRQHDPGLLLEAHRALAFTLLWLGEFASARAHAEQGTALYDSQQHHAHAFLYGQDPGMTCRAYEAMALWELGYPDQALARSHEALTIAQERSHPYSVAMALAYAAMIRHFRREVHTTHERAEATMTLCTEQGFPFFLALGTILRGWALAEQGAGEEGMGQICQGLAAWRATGTEACQTYFLVLLAEAQGKMGQAEAGLRVLTETLTLVDKTGERYPEAELYRLQGELLLKQAVSDAQQAETCFQQALTVARRQQAKAWELRAALSLSRLWQHQGKREEARQVLAEVYGWFAEGFDTDDLQEAKALLDVLL
jgi:TOMM system kinase/cyclase fusion protein